MTDPYDKNLIWAFFVELVYDLAIFSWNFENCFSMQKADWEKREEKGNQRNELLSGTHKLNMRLNSLKIKGMRQQPRPSPKLFRKFEWQKAIAVDLGAIFFP